MKKGSKLLCLLFIVLVACNKTENDIVQGTVLEVGNKKPISGAKVVLGKWENHSVSGEYDYQRIDSIITDQSGEYFLRYHKKPDFRYSVSCTHPDFFKTENSFEIRNNRNAHKDFDLVPFGFVKVRQKKTKTAYTFFTGYIDSQPFDNYYNPDPFDTIFPKVYKVAGNKNNQIVWSIREVSQAGGSVSMPIREVFVPAGDTVLLLFELN